MTSYGALVEGGHTQDKTVLDDRPTNYTERESEIWNVAHDAAAKFNKEFHEIWQVASDAVSLQKVYTVITPDQRVRIFSKYFNEQLVKLKTLLRDEIVEVSRNNLYSAQDIEFYFNELFSVLNESTVDFSQWRNDKETEQRERGLPVRSLDNTKAQIDNGLVLDTIYTYTIPELWGNLIKFAEGLKEECLKNAV